MKKLFNLALAFILATSSSISLGYAGEKNEVKEIKNHVLSESTTTEKFIVTNNMLETNELTVPVTKKITQVDNNNYSVTTSTILYFDKETNQPLTVTPQTVGGYDSSYSVYASVTSHYKKTGTFEVQYYAAEGYYTINDSSVKVWKQLVECGHNAGFSTQKVTFNPTGTSFNYSTGFSPMSTILAVYGTRYTLTVGRSSASSTWSFTVADQVN